tara:strand:+ start:833 stop:1264 length:432 start_codon:yes stop_codon:yes gene_type:complete
MKTIISLGLAAIMGFNSCKEEKNFVTMDEMCKYEYGILDINNNKKADKNDVFFLAEDTNLDGLTDRSYLHVFEEYGPYIGKDNNKYLDYGIETNSYEIWFDTNHDGHFDYSIRDAVDNSEEIMEAFKESGYNPRKMNNNFRNI